MSHIVLKENTSDRSPKTPLISVIVPVYNILQYLPRCVESICRQTYRNMEIILVDDGSTDGTGQLCDRLAEQDNRILVFHKENGGSSSARNLGIAHAKGSYLGFIDSDDYIEPDMYEQLMSAIQRYGTEIAQVGRDEIDEEGNRLPNVCHPPETEICEQPEDFMRELLMHRGDCSFCTKLVKRELFEIAVFPMGVLNEDFHLFIQFLPAVKGIVCLPKQAYHVFYRIGSNTRKEGKEEFSRVYADNVDNASLAGQIVAQKYPGLTAYAVRFGLFQRLDYLLHIPIGQMQENNEQYVQIRQYLRGHWKEAMMSPYLTEKNKFYLCLLAAAPKTVRRIHRKLQG